MKKSRILLVVLCLVLVRALAQTGDPFLVFVEQAPRFNGDLEQYMKEHIRYPAAAEQEKRGGTVTVQFVVETNGMLSDIKVVKPLAPDLNEEAVRVVSLMPPWLPGKQNGKAVRVLYTLPVHFALDKKNRRRVARQEEVVTEEVDPGGVDMIMIEPPPQENTVFSFAEQMPRFNGDLNKYISDHLQYPDIAKENGIEGNVYVQFIVEQNGTLTNIRVMKGIGWGMDEEAIRLVRSMPLWLPGKQNGITVRVNYNLQIRFKLAPQQNIVTTHPDSMIFARVQEPPRFKGYMHEYIKQNLHYPDSAKKTGKQGRVYVQFVVETDGTLTQVKAGGRMAGWGMDEEALRLVRSMPAWNPGKQNGKNVRVKHFVHIDFTLDIPADTTQQIPVRFAEQMPEFNGNLGQFIAENLRYPAAAKENKKEARVLVHFVVERDGTLSNVEVMNKEGWGMDEEAIRLVKSMPPWKPGKSNGRALRVISSLPVTFKLDE